MVTLKPDFVQTDHELRVIVWECTDVVDDDDGSKNGIDLYVASSLVCSTDEDEPNEQKTDTHLRSHDGKGSFNWRMKFPLKLPKQRPSDCPRLKLQICDADTLSTGNYVSTVNIPLAPFLRNYEIHCENNKPLKMVNRGHNKFWVHGSDIDSDNLFEIVSEKIFEIERVVRIRRREKILISMQLLPIKTAKKFTNGYGRNAPNHYPLLPPPIGRYSQTLLSKLSKLCSKESICICVLLILLFVTNFVSINSCNSR
eukprot:491642_1